MHQGWWGLSSPRCLVAPTQNLGGQCGQQHQKVVDIEPASIRVALLDVLEKHSGPGKIIKNPTKKMLYNSCVNPLLQRNTYISIT